MNPWLAAAICVAVLAAGAVGLSMCRTAANNTRYDRRFAPFQMSDKQVRDEFDRILARTWGPAR